MVIIQFPELQRTQNSASASEHAVMSNSRPLLCHQAACAKMLQLTLQTINTTVFGCIMASSAGSLVKYRTFTHWEICAR